MEDLRDRVAVVTGAASGIGLALASRFVDEGMRVLLADIEAAPLAEATGELCARGGQAIDVVTDVTDGASVEALAERCYNAFGACHVLCNNAGVLSGGLSWETPIEDWQWVFGVNVFGVVHCLRSFVPRMQGQGEAGHIVNVASMAAVTTVPYAAVYNASKHAVLALSESLFKELRASGSPIGVSVLCPEMIATRIGESDRNRHPQWKSPGENPSHEAVLKGTQEAAKRGLAPAVMAERVITAIRAQRFYILSEGEAWRAMADARCRDLLEGRDPSPDLPEALKP